MKKPWTVDQKELAPDEAMRFLLRAGMITTREYARCYGMTRFDQDGNLVLRDGTPVSIQDVINFEQ